MPRNAQKVCGIGRFRLPTESERHHGYTPRRLPHSSTCRRGLKRKPSRLQISASHTARSRSRSRSVPSGIRITRLRSASSARSTPAPRPDRPAFR